LEVRRRCMPSHHHHRLSAAGRRGCGRRGRGRRVRVPSVLRGDSKVQAAGGTQAVGGGGELGHSAWGEGVPVVDEDLAAARIHVCRKDCGITRVHSVRLSKAD
jgi:hypothetical protein